MDPARPTTTQARVLWWMVATGDAPAWNDGRPGWREDRHSTLCPHGLGKPYITAPAVRGMLDCGWLSLDDETLPACVVALPAADWPAELKLDQALRRSRGEPTMLTPDRRLRLTESGRAAAPEGVPYPWRPNLNGLHDVTRDEHERLRKVAALSAGSLPGGRFSATPAGDTRPPAPAAGLPPNVVRLPPRKERTE